MDNLWLVSQAPIIQGNEQMQAGNIIPGLENTGRFKLCFEMQEEELQVLLLEKDQTQVIC